MWLTKTKIRELVTKIEDFLRENEMLEDVSIYFNNKRRSWGLDYETKEYVVREEDDINPHDYFEWAATKHILSMSFEGGLYYVLNGYGDGSLAEAFLELFEEYEIFYELGDAWNLSCYPGYDNMEIEYTDYSESVKPEPEYIYLNKKGVLPELNNIMNIWYELSEKTGDKGCSVIGEGMLFEYKGKEYKMSSCSPWQGEGSWTPHIGVVREMLESIGATNITWNCGYMD